MVLQSDRSGANQVSSEYDTDLESSWSNPSNIFRRLLDRLSSLMLTRSVCWRRWFLSRDNRQKSKSLLSTNFGQRHLDNDDRKHFSSHFSITNPFECRTELCCQYFPGDDVTGNHLGWLVEKQQIDRQISHSASLQPPIGFDQQPFDCVTSSKSSFSL